MGDRIQALLMRLLRLVFVDAKASCHVGSGFAGLLPKRWFFHKPRKGVALKTKEGQMRNVLKNL